MGKRVKPSSGFTLVEVLFSFATFFFLIFVVVGVLRLTMLSSSEIPYEVDLFFQQASRDIRLATAATVETDVLYLRQKNGSIVTYEKFKTIIRRQLNDAGHEVLLQNIRTLHFETVPNGIKVLVVDQENRKYSTRLSFAPLRWGSS